MAQIELNASALDKRQTSSLSLKDKETIENLPGLVLDEIDLDHRPNTFSLTKNELAHFVNGLKVLVQTKYDVDASDPATMTLIKSICRQYIPNLDESLIKIDYISLSKQKIVEEEGKRAPASEEVPPQKDTGVFEKLIEIYLGFALLFLIGIGFIFALVKMLSKKLVSSFSGIEKSIQDLANTTMEAANATNNMQTPLNPVQNSQPIGNVDSDEVNNLLAIIEQIGIKDFESYKAAFKLYLDMDQVDEAILLVNMSATLAGQYPTLLGDTEARRFKNTLKTRVVELFESKESLFNAAKNVTNTLRMAKTVPDAVYNSVLRNNIIRLESDNDMDFSGFAPDEIGKIIELSNAEAIASRICNDQLSIAQIKGSSSELEADKAVQLISKLVKQSHQAKTNGAYQEKLLQIAMELPLDMERAFLSAMNLQVQSYPKLLQASDIDFILTNVRNMTLQDASSFLGCMNDEVRIDVVNKLPEIMAQRLNTKGYQVSLAGRRLKRRIWQQLINKRKGGISESNSKNNAA